MDYLNVTNIEDFSVKRKIEKTSKKLSKKFNKKRRRINENKLLKEDSVLRKVLFIIADIICSVLVLFGIVFCSISINCKMQNLVPSFAGFSSCTIVSPSMTKSGFEVGDSVIVRAVKTESLRGRRLDKDGNVIYGDIIAFYADNVFYDSSVVDTFIKVDKFEDELVYDNSFLNLFGIRNNEMVATAKAGSRIIFHHIVDVYEDKDGLRWFKTQGSSNEAPDQTPIYNSDGSVSYLACCFVSEQMIVGVYDDSNSAKVVSCVLSVIKSNTITLLCFLIPAFLLIIILIFECIKDVRLAIVECEVVEGSRKLTDKVCIRHNIGFNLSKKDKIKVLAHTDLSESDEVISLMWKGGSAPAEIKKYYLKKRLKFKSLYYKNQLNAKCKQMYEQGESDEAIAKYYIEEMEKIEKKEKRILEILKSIHKKAN